MLVQCQGLCLWFLLQTYEEVITTLIYSRGDWGSGGWNGSAGVTQLVGAGTGSNAACSPLQPGLVLSHELTCE